MTNQTQIKSRKHSYISRFVCATRSAYKTHKSSNIGSDFLAYDDVLGIELYIDLNLCIICTIQLKNMQE